MSKYAEKLKDPRWQKKRLEVLNRDGWQCRACCSGEKTLHVHHAYYVSGRDPWEYPSESLATFCADCHHGEDCESEFLMHTIESLIQWACSIAPEGAPSESVLADLGLAVGQAGREWRSGNRRRLTEDEWGSFCNAVTVLLEANFKKNPQQATEESQ